MQVKQIRFAGDGPGWWAIWVALTLLTACATPIGVNRVGLDRAEQQIAANALSGPQLSEQTRMVLARYGLDRLQHDAPDLAVLRLHERACQETRRDVLAALAELSYAVGRHYGDVTWASIRQGNRSVTLPGRTAARRYYFAAAVYSYLSLFGEGMDAPPDPFDRRFRVACDLYNRALVRALQSETSEAVELTSQVLPLPMGTVRVACDRTNFPWTEAQFHQFVAADEYVVRGLRGRTRQSGLGVPLVAIPDRAAFGAQWPRHYAVSLKAPATAFLRVHGTVGDLSDNRLTATLELYPAYTAKEIQVAGRTVPLEIDVTTTLAYALEGAVQWKARLAQFFSGAQLIPTGVYLPQPYERGKIPVVFVYGTAGSPSDWAGCFNTLLADPTLRARYQFWFFIYNTGNPIAYSGARLREGLDTVVRELDPQGEDPAVRNMVLVGHSQGGLVVKLAAVRSGDKFLRLLSDRPLEELNLSESNRELLRRGLVVEPSSYVRRVIFVCTPHRGSILVNNWIQRLGRRLIRMPQDLTRLGIDLATLRLGPREVAAFKRLRGKVPTSVANMNPNNPFLLALHDLPLADGITGHSIIAVRGDGPIETGNDGVVAYTSAHLEGMKSEYIVRWTHDCQNQPLTIEEVRRILLEHLTGLR